MTSARSSWDSPCGGPSTVDNRWHLWSLLIWYIVYGQFFYLKVKGGSHGKIEDEWNGGHSTSWTAGKSSYSSLSASSGSAWGFWEMLTPAWVFLTQHFQVISLQVQKSILDKNQVMIISRFMCQWGGIKTQFSLPVKLSTAFFTIL